MWFIKFSFQNPWIYKMGFLFGFLSLGIAAYKIWHTQGGNEFKRRFLHVQYAGMFWTGMCTLFYHPYYTGILPALFAIPMLAAQIRLAWFLIDKYGIGGQD